MITIITIAAIAIGIGGLIYCWVDQPTKVIDVSEPPATPVTEPLQPRVSSAHQIAQLWKLNVSMSDMGSGLIYAFEAGSHYGTGANVERLRDAAHLAVEAQRRDPVKPADDTTCEEAPRGVLITPDGNFDWHRFRTELIDTINEEAPPVSVGFTFEG